jgi:hypothetical protein
VGDQTLTPDAPIGDTGAVAKVLQSGVASAERAFEDVSFSYSPGKPLISELSLVAEPGQTVAIVGPTGAGKTSQKEPRQGGIELGTQFISGLIMPTTEFPQAPTSVFPPLVTLPVEWGYVPVYRQRSHRHTGPQGSCLKSILFGYLHQTGKELVERAAVQSAGLHGLLG